eukprot:CAMPEP_0175414818 /NCGR_PEP_ID=MMETSP0095-20121207/43861_1 /TAXON_ID=311494 /ORGANISM="Alexandrium monilatum, Strain CCMP3105" /LENGTH=167 /DNA_ID=CAMNT_0016713893 /DNA_START=87 /DNA_END=586 /DNA_ORIENTATION=+
MVYDSDGNLQWDKTYKNDWDLFATDSLTIDNQNGQTDKTGIDRWYNVNRVARWLNFSMNPHGWTYFGIWEMEVYGYVQTSAPEAWSPWTPTTVGGNSTTCRGALEVVNWGSYSSDCEVALMEWGPQCCNASGQFPAPSLASPPAPGPATPTPAPTPTTPQPTPQPTP